MTPIKCFWVEPTGREFGYASSYSESQCPAKADGFHHRAETDPVLGGIDAAPRLGPERCGCGYEFTERERSDSRGSYHEYRRADTGEILQKKPFPVGAMWHLASLDGEYLEHPENCTSPLAWKRGPDGLILAVMTPGGAWNIDSRASNCTMPEDNTHSCWVRHGTPPEITVDKAGNTCAAGAGSIQCGSYHGFLRAGFLVD